MPSRRSASILPTPRRITGVISTIASSPAYRRAPIAASSIAPGCYAEGLRHDALRLRPHHLRNNALRRAVEPRSSRAEAALERQRQRPDRPLCRAARASAACRRTGRSPAARASRAALRRAPLSASRRAAGEAHPGASRSDRLPYRTARHHRWRGYGRCTRTRPPRPCSAGLAGLPRARARRSLPHESHAAGLTRRPVFRASADDQHRRPRRSDLDTRGELTMPQSFARPAFSVSPPPRDSSSFPAIAAPLARRTGSHRSHQFCHHLSLAIVLVLLSANGVAHAQAGDRRVSAVTSESGRFARFVSEAALRFGIPTSWITAVMQAESRGVVRAVSPKGAMGLMQIMPDTWSGLRSRYGLGPNPFDPHDNIVAGAAYLRELHDRYGTAGFLAAYNAGPGRYEDHLTSGRPLPAETQAYVAALAPLLRDDGSMGNVITAIIRSWTSSPFFPVRANDASSTGGTSSGDLGKRRSMVTPATDWTGLAPQSEGLFAPVSERQPRL